MKSRVHVNINVRDLTASVAFYGALFDADPTKVREDYANFRLDTPGLHLALVRKPDHPPVQTEQHHGVELFDRDALDAWRARLETRGVNVRIEEQVTCCYAVADKFWVADPDGNEWEFWFRTEEAEAMHEDAAEGECCAPMPMATLEGLKPKQAPGGCC